MTHDERHTDAEMPVAGAAAPESDERPLPPIPDGGLASGMPDWLTRPTPATLRRMARRSGLTDLGGLEPVASDFVRSEDVPGWLQAVRRRATVPASPAQADAPALVPTPAPRVEPIFVEARPRPEPTVDAGSPALRPAVAPEPPPTPAAPVVAPPPPAPIVAPSSGLAVGWIVVGVLIALAIAFAIGMLAGSGYRP